VDPFASVLRDANREDRRSREKRVRFDDLLDLLPPERVRRSPIAEFRLDLHANPIDFGRENVQSDRDGKRRTRSDHAVAVRL
jgi:hypothetical protein